jgi:aminoglycoside phosphotransferase (APT) family kinase protein
VSEAQERGLDGTSASGTVAVRDGEQLDVSALREWMVATNPVLVPAGSALDVRQFPSGFSNLTYLVSVHHAPARLRFVLRRPPHGVGPGIAHDMTREHGLLTALHPLGVPVPRPVAVCTDPTVLGAPFYLMEHVDGVILRGAPSEALLQDPALPARMTALSRTFVSTLAHLHAVRVDGTPLAALGKPDGYVQRQVQGWTRRWESSRIAPVRTLDMVAAWLDANRPPERGVALVHNDFKLDNLVLEPDLSRVRAILDWEMATVGDPLMDLGTTLAYWVEANDAPVFRSLGLGITALPGAFTRAELVTAYAEASGREVQDVSFYYAFGLFKVAVIAQQIYARFVNGKTADPRFGRLGAVVAALGEAAAESIEKRKL